MSPKNHPNLSQSKAHAKIKTQECFDFVNISGIQETKDVELRRRVRVNAARAYWRLQRKRRVAIQPYGIAGREDYHPASVLRFPSSPVALQPTETLFPLRGTKPISTGSVTTEKAGLANQTRLDFPYNELTTRVKAGRLLCSDDLQGSSPSSLPATTSSGPDLLKRDVIRPFRILPISDRSDYNSLTNDCKLTLIPRLQSWSRYNSTNIWRQSH